MQIEIVNFSKNTSLQGWRVVDDVVMGGRSSGNFTINKEGYGLFFGTVSTANNGGFSSVRFSFNTLFIGETTNVVLRVKGDGKKYQLRIKDKARKYYSYTAQFSTNGTWQNISIPLKDMYPTFRGQKLRYPNFDKNTLEEIAVLIGNKRNEEFQLEIERIYLE